jgi:NDP-sugar pyrophosphorylase family protein
MKANKAIIIAGGKGTRLYPITLETPKPLLTVHRKAILTWLCEMFVNQAVNKILIIINKNDQEEFNWWLTRFTATQQSKDWQISFIIEEEPLGTFGMIKSDEVRSWINNETFFMSNGDELKEVDLKGLEEIHNQKQPIATIALVEVKNPEEYGVALMSGDQVTGFLEKPEKPPGNFVSSGLYLLSPEIFKYVSDQKFEMFEKIRDSLATQGKICGFKFKGRWYDCGTLARWETAMKEW